MRVIKICPNYGKTIIPKEILRLFKPFYYYHTLMCVRQYNIKDNRVERISRWNVLCGFLMSCSIICCFNVNIKLVHFDLTRFTIVYHILLMFHGINFLVVCFLNFYCSSLHMRLMTALEDVSRSLLSRKDLKKLRICSWGFVIAVMLCHLHLIVLKLIYDANWTYLRAALAIVGTVLNMGLSQIVFCVYVIYYLFEKWNTHLEKIKFNNNDDEISLEIDTVVAEMFYLLRSIKKAWKYTKKLSEFMVLCHFISTFIQILAYVLYYVAWLKTSFLSKSAGLRTTQAVTAVSLLSKFVGLDIILCACCEMLYEEIARAHINVFKRCPKNLSTKRMWKNMRRMIRNDFQKMSACGVFTVNAATMLSFSDVMTTYIIVALQFDYL